MDNVCSNCVFFAKPDDSSFSSECRAYPPTFHPQQLSLEGKWPAINDDDWCGKFKSANDNSTRTGRMGFHHGQGA